MSEYKKDRVKVKFVGTHAIVDSALEVDKKVLILLPTAHIAREIVRSLKSKTKLDRFHIGYNEKSLRGIFADFGIIHEDCSPELIALAQVSLKMTPREQEAIANFLLKKDSNRELCRICKDGDPDSLPYGEETGHVESMPQFDKEGNPYLDEEENQLYLDYPELECSAGHRWFKGEGARRDIRGKNPILFESHLKNRYKREIQSEMGIPDPAFSTDRFGNPVHLIYNRVTPNGRRVNDESSRQAHGASFYAN